MEGLREARKVFCFVAKNAAANVTRNMLVDQ